MSGGTRASVSATGLDVTGQMSTTIAMQSDVLESTPGNTLQLNGLNGLQLQHSGTTKAEVDGSGLSVTGTLTASGVATIFGVLEATKALQSDTIQSKSNTELTINSQKDHIELQVAGTTVSKVTETGLDVTGTITSSELIESNVMQVT